MIDGFEKLAEYKAISSFGNCAKTLKQMQEIIMINSQKARVIQLKDIAENLLGELSIKERMLIEYKYFKYKMPEGFDYNSRNYFRAQIRVFNKLVKKMNERGYDQDWFESNFLDIFVLDNKYKKLKRLKESGATKNCATEAWV